jgi:hypothetical protein
VRLPHDRLHDWMRSKYPWMYGYGWRSIVVVFMLSVVVIAVGLWVNPPSKVRQEFYRSHPDLAPNPNKPLSKSN